MKRSLTSGLLIFMACCAGAQTPILQIYKLQSPSPNRKPISGQTVTFAPMSPSIEVITGAPFCAEQHAQAFHTNSDGTQAPAGKEAVSQTCRDSKGRTYAVNPLPFSGRNPDNSNILIYKVRDPVSGFQYLVDTLNHVAHRFPLKVERDTALNTALDPSSSQAAQRAANSPNPKRPTSSTVSLGTQVFDGEPAEGTRRTTTFPTGSRGNDAPFSEVYEAWISPYLRIPILEKITSPLTHDSTIRLVKISRVEPEPNLFVIPSDYKIGDEIGSFEITWKFN